MSSCKRISKKADLVCIGDLDERITVYDRNIQPPVDVKYSENLTGGISKWCMIKTTSGIDIFDSTNQLIGSASHIFIVRNDSTLTSEFWLEYDNRYFDILNIERLNENKRFMALLCSERGSKSKAVNLL